MEIMRKIQIYGDSIMKGVEMDASKRYILPQECGWGKLESEFPLSISNNSKFGCTITKGIGQLERSLKKGLSCDMVLLEYGGNDCDFNWKEVAERPFDEHHPHTDLPVFEETYRKMVHLLKQHGITPIIMSLPPIDAEKYFEWICVRDKVDRKGLLCFLGDVQRIYRYQEMYSDAACKVAWETGAVLADVRRAFLDKRNFKDLLCDDGIHPNKNGHALMGETFEQFTRTRFSMAEA